MKRLADMLDQYQRSERALPTYDELRAIVAAPAAPSEQAEPSGWKRVPVEPTSAMIEAAAKADDEGFEAGRSHGASGREIFAAMVAAAPAAPLPAQPGEFGQKVTALIAEIIKAKSLAWRDSKVEELIELIEPSAFQLQQSGSIRPSAEPVGQHDSGVAASDPAAWIRADQAPNDGLFVALYEGDAHGRFVASLCGYGEYDAYDYDSGEWESRHGWHESVMDTDGASGDVPRSVVAYFPGNYDLESLKAVRAALAEPADQTSSAACGGCSPSSPVAGAAPLPELTGPSEAQAWIEQAKSALEQLENGALNVAGNAKLRGDLYDEGYANTMAKMCADTLASLAASPSPAPAQPTMNLTPDALRDAVAEGLKGLYYCGRVWSAWGVGTMSQDDFTPAEESDECIDNVVDHINGAIQAAPAPTEPQGAAK